MYLLWERNDSGKMLEYLIWWGGSIQTASLSVLCWDLTQQNDILGCIPISGAGNDSWSWCWFAGWWVLQGRHAGCSVSLLAAGVGNNSLVNKKTQISSRLWEGSGGSDCSVSSECHRVCVLSGFSPGFELGVLNTQLMWGSASPVSAPSQQCSPCSVPYKGGNTLLWCLMPLSEWASSCSV